MEENKKIERDPRKQFLQIAVVVLVLILGGFDFLSMNNLFLSLDLADTLFIGQHEYTGISEAMIYSFMMVMFLEGNPFFLGMMLANMTDKTAYKTNDRMIAKIGFWIAMAGLILTFVIAMCMRYFLIAQSGGFDAFFCTQTYGGSEDTNMQFIAQFFLLWSPILTSMLAFVASFVAFRNDSADKLAAEIERLQAKYLNLDRVFKSRLGRLDDLKYELWASVNQSPSARMPERQDTFRKECIGMIRKKVTANSIDQFPQQVSRFNSEIESALEGYMKQLCEASIIPREKWNLSTEDVLNRYDEAKVQAGRPADAWSYRVAGEEMRDELRRALIRADMRREEAPEGGQS